MSGPKILLLDIESSPHSVFVWDLKPYYISPDMMTRQGGVLCFAAKWLGEKDMMFWSAQGGKRNLVRMMKAAHRLICEADVLVHYNGQKFDIPMLHKEMIELGMTPPDTPTQIDLLKVVRRKFRFPSNKLSYVAGRLHLGAKTPHKGLELWIKCMAGDKAAWAHMEKYNRQDVVLTEKLYMRLRPWIDNHVDLGLWMPDGSRVCPKCKSTDLLGAGIRAKGTQMYKRWQCRGCGAWPRERVNSTPAHRKGKALT